MSHALQIMTPSTYVRRHAKYFDTEMFVSGETTLPPSVTEPPKILVVIGLKPSVIKNWSSTTQVN